MKLAINGINLGAMMSATDAPKETVREIGESAQGADGSTVITRLTKKKDLSFASVLLTHAQAHAWLSLITGEGEAWSFDSSLYGSKGTGPNASVGATQSAGSAKYGAGKLSLAATTGSITFPSVTVNEFGGSVGWTVMFWRFSGGAYHWYLARSDSSYWTDGVFDPMGAFTFADFLTVGSGNVTLKNITGGAVSFDDLVVLPFAVLDDWPAQIFAAAVAFGPTPYLNATGDLVTEAATRVVLGRAEESTFMLTGSGLLRALHLELVAK